MTPAKKILLVDADMRKPQLHRVYETDNKSGLSAFLSGQTSFKDIILNRVNPTDADLASDETLNAWLMKNTGTSHHISGTCKMGPDSDPKAVLDQYCHVRGIENLRVADASVMPDCIRANTNATTIMIGEKVADWIKEGR